jgi:SAM-dependent MidA family methyltransferase
METCLYDPIDGFFTAGRLRPGERGDFVTSPEVSPLFGSLIGAWAGSVARDGWALIEVGSGSGNLLSAMHEAVPSLDPWAVERSDAARAATSALVPDAVVVDSVADVLATHAVVVMNEVLDNAPAALVRRRGERYLEVAVGVEGEALVLTEVEARSAVVSWAERFLQDLAEGRLASVQIGAWQLLTDILERFDGVALCVIDYGGGSAMLTAQPEEHVVRTYRHQRTGFDFLAEPGDTDITVDVNVDAVVELGTVFGAKVAAMTQREFLLQVGARTLLDTLTDTEHEAARSGDVMTQLKTRSESVGLRALLDPAGFGTFKVVTMLREPDA